MPRDLAGGVGEVHDAGRGGAVLAAEDAVAEAEVQRRPDDDDEVGAAQRHAARLGHQQRVAAGYDAAAHAVGDGGKAGLLDDPQGGLLGAVGPDVGAEDEHGPRGLPEQLGDVGDRVAVGLDPPARADHRTGDGRGVEELVHRDVEEDRAAVRGAGQR